MNSPSVTDWIQAIGVLLGFPSAVWGIVLLFRKDMEKEKKIQHLSKIADSQNALMVETQKQVLELQKQSICLEDANVLLRKQIDIQSDAVLNDKEYKEKYLQLERTKRMNTIKPHFKVYGSGYNGTMFNASFRNIGKRAYDCRIVEIESNNLSIIGTNAPQNVETEKNLQISGERHEKVDGNWPEHYAKLKMVFFDEDKNEYAQEIVVEDGVTIDKPLCVKPHVG